MAHPDLDALFNFLVQFAQQCLGKYGEFYPFGASMTEAGEIKADAAYTGDEHPPSQELTGLLTSAFRQQAQEGKIRAAGICLDVRAVPPGQTEKTDAICVRLEHANSEAVEVFLPYVKDSRGAITYGELFACRGQQGIFPRKPG